MFLKLNGKPEIEDVWNHTPESVEALRSLLVSGAPAQVDPQRSNFYEVENCSRVFYIHITPRGKVLLLAIWSKDVHHRAAMESARFAAASP